MCISPNESLQMSETIKEYYDSIKRPQINSNFEEKSVKVYSYTNTNFEEIFKTSSVHCQHSTMKSNLRNKHKSTTTRNTHIVINKVEKPIFNI